MPWRYRRRPGPCRCGSWPRRSPAAAAGASALRTGTGPSSIATWPVAGPTRPRTWRSRRFHRARAAAASGRRWSGLFRPPPAPVRSPAWRCSALRLRGSDSSTSSEAFCESRAASFSFRFFSAIGAVQFHDRAAGFHGVARLLEEMDHPAFGGGGEDGKSLRDRLAMPQPGDLVGDRPHFRRLDANADVGLVAIRGGLAAVAASQQARQHKDDDTEPNRLQAPPPAESGGDGCRIGNAIRFREKIHGFADCQNPAATKARQTVKSTSPSQVQPVGNRRWTERRRTAKSGVWSIFQRERLEIRHGRCPKTWTCPLRIGLGSSPGTKRRNLPILTRRRHGTQIP